MICFSTYGTNRTLSDPFPAMAADSTARANFAQNCIDLVKAYNFDGIDIGTELNDSVRIV